MQAGALRCVRERQGRGSARRISRVLSEIRFGKGAGDRAQYYNDLAITFYGAKRIRLFRSKTRPRSRRNSSRARRRSAIPAHRTGRRRPIRTGQRGSPRLLTELSTPRLSISEALTETAQMSSLSRGVQMGARPFMQLYDARAMPRLGRYPVIVLVLDAEAADA